MDANWKVNKELDMSVHPIAGSVRARIEQALDEIERNEGVKVLFACESGSRGWGFASPDSDYDVRFVYVPRLDWYLSVLPGRDVIELPIDDELDVSGWELRKALGLLRNANPVLLEWLDSPVVYRAEPAWLARMRELVPRHFSPLRAHHHYLSMAKKNFRGYLQGDEVRLKKYFYVLRPLLAVQWISRGLGQPPMRFAELVDGVVEDGALRAEIDDLLALKRASGEALYGARRPRLHDYIVAALAEAEEPREFVQSDGELAELDAFLAEIVLAWDKAGRHE